jgi:hypothetical protein
MITENLPNLEKERIIHVQEAFRTMNRKDLKRIIPLDILKTLNVKNQEIILKAAREK